MSSLPHTLPLPPPIARDWALFLDLDGSLLEFAPAPDAVAVPAQLPSILLHLRDCLGGALALVSGRALSSLDALFPELAHAPAAGLHGLQRRGADGRLHHAPPATAALAAVRDEAMALRDAWPGLLVEAKGPALALHWRGAPDMSARVRAFADAALSRLPDYVMQLGDHVVELRPRGDGTGKGGAVQAFMADAPFRGRTPVFVGDDLTDEHGFTAVLALGGFGVRVGLREPTAASCMLPSPRAVHRWLADGLDAMKQGAGHG